MKRILLLALIAALTLSSLFSCANNTTEETEETESKTEEITRLPAQDVTGEGFELLLSEDKSYYIFSGIGTCADTKITVPATFNGLPVKAIAENAFAACEGITEITVSEGITEIGKGAFSYSKNLKEVKLPSSVTEISERAFYNASSLESVTLGSSTSIIGVSAFENCSALKAISLPSSVKEIRMAAFFNCEALTDITLGESIEKIEHSAFDLTAFATTPQNWKNDELYCGKYLLRVLPTKADALNVKDGTLLIADQAAKRAKISSVSFPSSLKYIGTAAFTACQGITEIKINEGALSIGDNAFSSCDSLVSVSLPSTLTSIEAFAFYHCSALKEITIPSGVTKIADQTFNECASLASVTLHDKLTDIGVYSFANCYSLQKIVFPDSLTTIGESSFYKCYNLLSINLPKNLNKIENWAFQYCHKLVDVKNESKIEIIIGTTETSNGYIGVYAKETHNGESKIVEQDGYLFYTFGGKNYLMGYTDMNATDLTLPESFDGKSYILYKYAFSFRPELQKLTIASGATAINSNSIDNCPSLTELTLGKSVTSIAKNAVNLCPDFNKLIFLGTEEEFNSININATNVPLLNAQRVYN